MAVSDPSQTPTVREGDAPAHAVARLDELIRAAYAGHGPARDATLACAYAVLERQRAGDDGLRAILEQVAATGGHPAALAWLCGAPPRRSLAPRGRLAELPLRAHLCPSDLSSWLRGARVVRVDGAAWVVRSPQRQALSHELLLRHPDDGFIERLLACPELTRRDALRLASRRPSTPAIAAALALSPRWVRDAAVREALVYNPFTPGGLAARLAPTVSGLRRRRADAT